MAAVAAYNALTSTKEEMGNQLAAANIKGKLAASKRRATGTRRQGKALSSTETQRLAILKEFEKQQARAAEAKQEREELATNNKDLTNRISQLTASIGDLNVNLTNAKQLNDEKSKVSDLSAELRAAEAIAEREKQAATAAKTEAKAAQQVAAAANTPHHSQCRGSGSQSNAQVQIAKVESRNEFKRPTRLPIPL